MSEVSNYQWPQCFIKKVNFINYSNTKTNKIKNEIEEFFSKKLFSKAILFPSARSCIGAIIEFNKIGRGNEVYVNKWVSNCLFNTIGYYSNPTINLNDPDLFIFNNLWGVKQKIFKKAKLNKKVKLIDDSCDSILLKKSSTFPNNSDYEIFSLPKIIGSISGGIVISRNKKFINFCIKRQKKNKKLSILQSKLKFSELNKKSIFDYRYNEPINSYLEKNALVDILKKLKNYEINKNLIIKRIKILQNCIKFEIDNDRVGPVIAIELSKLKNQNKLKKYFLIRHKLKNYKKNHSKKYLLFPLHFKISEQKFNNYLKILKKNIK